MASFPTEFETRLPVKLHHVFQTMDSPIAVQAYLDGLPYIGEERDRSPLNVMRDGQCHCLDGALFAALALWQIGFQPLLTDLVPAPGLDDDHVLALFQVDSCWGAVAKSNYAGLRYREPVYRSLRELVMSYFEDFFNSKGQRTLRGYTRPFDLSRYPETGWCWDEPATQALYRRFYARTTIRVISEEVAGRLHPLDERSFKSGTHGTDFGEVYPREDRGK
jgi:hypothetical protein